MLFSPGVYEHIDKQFTIAIRARGDIYLSPNAPLSMRLSDIFDVSKWNKVDDKIETV